jgi:hypothetical protein
MAREGLTDKQIYRQTVGIYSQTDGKRYRQTDRQRKPWEKWNIRLFEIFEQKLFVPLPSFFRIENYFEGATTISLMTLSTIAFSITKVWIVALSESDTDHNDCDTQNNDTIRISTIIILTVSPKILSITTCQHKHAQHCKDQLIYNIKNKGTQYTGTNQMALSITTHSLTTVSIIILTIQTLCIMTFSIQTLCTITLSKMTISIADWHLAYWCLI